MFSISVDGNQLYTGPQAASWWEEGQFDTSFPGIDNPWAAGTNMAPFDQEVTHTKCNEKGVLQNRRYGTFIPCSSSSFSTLP